MDNQSLDDFVQKHGTIDNEEIKCVDKDKIQDNINNTFAYEDNATPIPGEDVDYRISEQLNNINKDTAMESLITKAAIAKAKNESAKSVLTKEQRAEQRKQYIEAMMYQQGELYYQQHHYIMDGKTKRRVRKRIEHDYDKGRTNKLGIYFEQPKTRQIIRKPKTQNTEPVNMSDMLKM